MQYTTDMDKVQAASELLTTLCTGAPERLRKIVNDITAQARV
jgi:hypothetical protein